MEQEYSSLAERYAISAREYFYTLRLAIYHVDGAKTDTSYEVAQYKKSPEVYWVACNILNAMYNPRTRVSIKGETK